MHAKAMKAPKPQSIELRGQKVEYRVVASKTAGKLRVRVGLDGVEVVQPAARNGDEVGAFLRANEKWVLGQIERVESSRGVRWSAKEPRGQLLYRGEMTPVRVEEVLGREGPNRVVLEAGAIVVRTGITPATPPARTLENWLRKEARAAITAQLDAVCRRVRREPGKVYVMAQRTKWGNCSALGNLSFNWRLIMAPDYVLRYLVTHEAVHLAVPDHSRKFWLTVQSLCPETERAKQWLCANGHRILDDVNKALG